MSKLLLNGCSYGQCYSKVSDLASALGIENSNNISCGGGSNDRIFRTTVNYVLENSVDFVLMALTGWDRFEAPWIRDDDFTQCWVDYGPYGVMNHDNQTEFPCSTYDRYIQDRYRYDIDIRYVEKMLTNLIMISGWLENQKIPYLIYSSCGGVFTDFEGPGRYGHKYEQIKNNPRIIDLENWCSNQFLYESGARCFEYDINCLPSGRHYLPEDHTPLTNFLYNYISTNQLL